MASKKRYKLTIAYDGTAYEGWQVQPHGRTVANTIEAAFKRQFGRPVSVLAASRTDSGVHALGQIAKVDIDLSIPDWQLKKAWNLALPQDILIRSLEEAPSNFNPFFGVDHKVYYYHLFFERPLPFFARYGWHYPYMSQVNLSLFEDAMQLFVGEHDFRSFCKENATQCTIRTIDGIFLSKHMRFGMLQVAVVGKGFLRFQIRRMIGAALDASRRPDMSLETIRSMLQNPCSEQATTKASGQGLCLRSITYKKRNLKRDLCSKDAK